jgi:hypothetical protein
MTRRLDRRARSDLVIALFTVGLFLVGLVQCQTMLRSDEHYVKQERAFVFRDKYNFRKTGKDAWNIFPVIKNSGLTPISYRIWTDNCQPNNNKVGKTCRSNRHELGTRNPMRLMCPALFPKDEKMKTIATPRIRAPSQSSEDEGGAMLQDSISTDEMQKAVDVRVIYVFGQISYYDDLEKEQRKTRFCDGIIPGKIVDDREANYELVATCTGNCMDGQCTEEDSYTKCPQDE